jgi:hypothetical protein
MTEHLSQGREDAHAPPTVGLPTSLAVRANSPPVPGRYCRASWKRSRREKKENLQGTPSIMPVQ